MGARLFRFLVRLMPRAFRSEYGEEMCRVADERWAEKRAVAGPLGATRFWARQAMALLGASARLRHDHYESTGKTTMNGFAHDLRLAVRGILRRPGFAAVTVATLGLGIGSSTSIFSAVHAVLFRPLPYRDADRVAVVFQTAASTGMRGDGVSAANMRDLAEAATLLGGVSVAEPWSLDYQVEGRTESLRTWSVSVGFFEAAGAEPLLGRMFTDGDYTANEPVVVLGHRAWVERFASDPSVVGSTVMLDAAARTVIGVLAADFRFPDAADTWIPRTPQSSDQDSRASDFMTGLARLRDGVSFEQAQAEADRVATALREAHPRLDADLGFRLVPLRDYLFGDVRTPLGVMTGAVLFVLLIACANVAGLMLARGAQRERDFALRSALGAGAGRLVGHVVTESLVLAAAGCALGVALTHGGLAAIRALGPDAYPRLDEMSVDGTVLVFAIAASALCAILSGIAPSVRLSRPDLRAALGDGARGSVGGLGPARTRARLVVGQVAAAVVLLVGAGLLARSFRAVMSRDLGFDPEGRVALQVFAYEYGPSERDGFVRDASENLAALPGVSGVALTTNLPAADDGVIANIEEDVPFFIQGRAAPPSGQEPRLSVIQTSAGYFDVMGIRVVSGRDFATTDRPDGQPVLIVNRALARRHFGDADPLGEQILVRFGNRPVPREIVGVVADTRPLGHASEPRPEAYLPLSQVGAGSLTFVVRGSANAATLVRPAMDAVWDANPSQAIWGALPVEDLVSGWQRDRRFTLFLIGTFSGLALLLSAIGLYGLVSFSVERRLGELGIRRALGGRDRDLLGLVLGEGTRLAIGGLAIGLTAAWYLSRFLSGMLFEVSPTDPTTFVGLSGLVLAIATLATLIPALRAIRADPVDALRSD